VTPERAPLPDVIAHLARDGRRVAPLPSPLARWRAWTLRAAIIATIVTLALGVRHDLPSRAHDTRFLLAATVTGLLALTAAGIAFMHSVPGALRGRSRVARVTPLIAAIAWAGLLWIRLAALGDPLTQIAATPRHPACVYLILTISALPGVLLFGMLRRAAPLDPYWTGMFAALGALALGALGTQFVCPIDAPGHHLLWHFVPVIVLTFVGLGLGSHLSRWHRQTSAGTFRRLP
jgi:hypothetical protein